MALSWNPALRPDSDASTSATGPPQTWGQISDIDTPGKLSQTTPNAVFNGGNTIHVQLKEPEKVLDTTAEPEAEVAAKSDLPASSSQPAINGVNPEYWPSTEDVAILTVDEHEKQAEDAEAEFDMSHALGLDDGQSDHLQQQTSSKTSDASNVFPTVPALGPISDVPIISKSQAEDIIRSNSDGLNGDGLVDALSSTVGTASKNAPAPNLPRNDVKVPPDVTSDLNTATIIDSQEEGGSIEKMPTSVWDDQMVSIGRDLGEEALPQQPYKVMAEMTIGGDINDEQEAFLPKSGDAENKIESGTWDENGVKGEEGPEPAQERSFGAFAEHGVGEEDFNWDSLNLNAEQPDPVLPTDHQGAGLSTKSDELSDLWRAALDDDEFLPENNIAQGSLVFAFDDGEGFLDDESQPSKIANIHTAQVPESHQHSSSGARSASNRYTPTASTGPAMLSFSNAQSRPAAPSSLPSADSFQMFSQLPGPPASQLPTPSAPTLEARAQSFVDKSKGGYVSPYDLPQDITKPRRRAPAPSTPSYESFPDRPPRSSSINSPLAPAPTAPPSMSQQVGPPSQVGHHSAAPNVPRPPTTPSGFFEELPAARPRPPSRTTRSIPPPINPAPPLPSNEASNRQVAPEIGPPQPISSTAQQYQLVPPEKLSLFGEQNAQQAQRYAAPVANSRYSPAPAPSYTAPPHRYVAPGTTAPRPPSVTNIPHQPRTSSPLAQGTPYTSQKPPPRTVHSQPQLPAKNSAAIPNAAPSYSKSAQSFDQTSAATTSSVQTNYGGVPSQASLSSTGTTFNSPPSQYTNQSPYFNRTASPPSSLASHSGISSVGHDQSSSDTRKSSVIHHAVDSNAQTSALMNDISLPPSLPPSTLHTVRASVARQGPEENVNYLPPQDGREIDPLERWRGCPIFSFGFGGSVVKMFPQRVPRYTAGQRAPQIKCEPGEVKVNSAQNLGTDSNVSTFPGPLRSKGKKKETLDWLQKRIQDLEQIAIPVSQVDDGFTPLLRRERILLWRVVYTFVEFDGGIDSNPEALKTINKILNPQNVQAETTLGQTITSTDIINSIVPRQGFVKPSTSSDAEVLEQIRKLLHDGNREQAVWLAVDNRLWSHAMLLSSTLEKDKWKQVIQEFVRQEMRPSGNNTESLAALYQVFAGNLDECIDELVPPSARAGFQMISKTSGSESTRNALDGLNKWTETLNLVLNNRTNNDSSALVSLGQLLANYGRIEAAHICYLFANTHGLFGGPEEPSVKFARLGVDHWKRPFDYVRDLDSLLLTEVYDFVRTTLSSSPTTNLSPHLQAHKLYHAQILAENSRKTEAQQYCDVILNTLKSTTKPSPYYHAILYKELEYLQDRLRQAPSEASGSWISKPKIDKVSGSIWAKFNSYVAGEDENNESTGTAKPQDLANGPFANVAGESPTLSRQQSSNELFNAYSSNPAPSQHSEYTPQPRHAARGNYAPSANYTSATHTRHTDSPSSTNMSQNYSPHYPAPTGLDVGSSENRHADALRGTPNSNYAPTQSYTPEMPHLQSPEAHASSPAAITDSATASYQPQIGSQESSFNYGQASSAVGNGPEEVGYSHGENAPYGYQPPTTDYEPPKSSYEPITSSYEPPTYEPNTYAENEDSASSEATKRKKSIMDLDEDENFEARATALRKEEKARKDREADEAFRKAAEEDAKKDKVPKLNNKKSWFGGGWFGKGAEKPSDGLPNNKPVQVKLGEEKSAFYYDEKLKRWVNPNNASTDGIATPAPPPPKGPPSRSASAMAPPRFASSPAPPLPTPGEFRAVSGPLAKATPPGLDPQSRSASPAMIPGTPPTSAGSGESPAAATGAGAAAPPSGPPSAPPSRPATSQGGASNIDDLFVVGQARKGGTVKKSKKGRGYVDVLGK